MEALGTILGISFSVSGIIPQFLLFADPGKREYL